MVLFLIVNFQWMGSTLPAQTLTVIFSSSALGAVSLMKRCVCVCVSDLWYSLPFVQLIKSTLVHIPMLLSVFRF